MSVGVFINKPVMYCHIEYIFACLFWIQINMEQLRNFEVGAVG